MLFCSQAYAVFVAVVFAVYWAMPWPKARVYLLLASSFFFYASWNRWLACLIAVSTLIDYVLARVMDGSQSRPLRRCLLTLSITGNLGLLCYFKYANFFLDSLQTTLTSMGAAVSIPALAVILPVGISFYTFEAINYMVDVYQKRLKAERSLPHFMLFITFFPHLVAGPIVRARDFLPQIDRPKRWNWSRMNLGVQLFLLGLVKKVIIADRLASFVDPIYAHPTWYSTHNLWLAVLAYALQVYGDFSGYTDMAIGSAHLFGYKLARNFNMPYLSVNLAEFWRRWHISLSSWLRDYVYFPLGGSRQGRWQTCRNLVITMTLAGLWHGAAWHFVVHGVLMGALLAGHRLYRDCVDGWRRWRAALATPIGTGLCVALTFMTFTLSLVVFRAPSLHDAVDVYRLLITPFKGTAFTPVHASTIVLAFLVFGVGHWTGSQRKLHCTLRRLPAPLTGLAYSLAFSLVLVMAPASGKAFIYFQF